MSGLRNFFHKLFKSHQRKAARVKRGSPYRRTPASGWEELNRQEAIQLWKQPQRVR